MSSPARAPDRATQLGLLRWHAERLVADVQKADPARRAALRRGIGHPPQHSSVRAAHAIVARHLPRGADDSTEWALYAVAALIAAQPRPARDQDSATTSDRSAAADSAAAASGEPTVTNEPLGSRVGADITADADTDPVLVTETAHRKPAHINLGATLAAAVLTGRLKADTTEARLHLLCRQDLAGLHRHLPRLSAHLRSSQKPVPIDWVTLIADLAQWGPQRDLIAKQWLQSYYRAIDRGRQHTETDTETDSASDTSNDNSNEAQEGEHL